MLVLTRKNGESLVIGEVGNQQTACRVTVLAIQRGKVKLAIEASPEIPVHRSEIRERMILEAAVQR